MTDDEIEACFAAGRNSPEWGKCPYDPATREAHWWTLGFAHTARILRAIDAERDAKRYRRLGALVEFGEWGVCQGEVVDSFGRTEETHMDDKTDMDAWLDKPEVIAEAQACAIALAKHHGIPAPEPKEAPSESLSMVLVPHYRGYARLGIGAYLLNISAAGEPAELIISMATEEEKADRAVGEDADNKGEAIQPEVMAVRLRFENVAGLDALEKRLRMLREEHFPEDKT